jgi:GT2 family glycosyltransferase
VTPAVSIVIPVYNALEHARQCLAAVYAAATRIPFETIVVNNGSSPDVAAWLAEETAVRPNLTVLSFPSPLGFAGAVNAGMRTARHEFLVPLNSDAVVTDGWLDGLVDLMIADPKIGIASPVTNHSGPGPQLVEEPPQTGSCLPPIYESRRLFFFCVMIRRELWDSLQGLDEIYGVGTYEDDDFCLRARLAGWRMAVDPNVFILNHASRTFSENRIDREEWLFRNEKLFLERASLLSRSSPPARYEKEAAASVSVIVAAGEGAGQRLIDSLHSLANQTVGGFETLVVFASGAPPVLPGELAEQLGIRVVAGSGWNVGTEAAKGTYRAYLPAGDIWFPYHLEFLHNRISQENCGAVYSGWSVAVHGTGQVRRSAVSDYECRPERLQAGPWAPLVAWIHHRDSAPPEGFREDLESFSEWDFTLRLRERATVCFQPGVTCERNRPGGKESPSDAETVMNSFPASTADVADERRQFLKAVAGGIWEETLIVAHHEREHRARRLFSRKPAPPPACPDPVRDAAQRIAAVRADQATVAPAAGPIDFVFLNILAWTDLTQRPHHFATELAKRGHRVFWVDVNLLSPEHFTGAVAPRPLANNLWEIRLPGHAGGVYHFTWNPAVLDLMTAAFGQLREARGIGPAVQLVHFPGWTPLAQSLRQSFGWPIVYDCLDDQYAFGELYGQPATAARESELTHICDVLVTSGHRLAEMKAAQGRTSVLIPNAADYGVFSAGNSLGLLDNLPHPVIGFFGVFADWLDFEWIENAARRFPAFSFVYVGCEGFAKPESRQRWREAIALPNIHLRPRADLPTLAAYLAQFDVCTMPFQDLPITRSMHAVKIYEYLAAGKHILVPALPEMLPFAASGLLTVYRDHAESFVLLEQLAERSPSANVVTDRKAFAARNVWSERVDRLLAAVLSQAS